VRLPGSGDSAACEVYGRDMGWIIGGSFVVFFAWTGVVLKRREARQPTRLDYQSGHHDFLGEAPPVPHHRLGRRN
jgi:hypothetical protein